MFATINQPYIFLGIIYGGILLGFIYGFFSIIRAIFKNTRLSCAIADSLFFVIGSILILRILYYTDDMHLRFYSLLGIAAGFLIYYFGLHTLIKYIFKKVKKR